MNSPVQAPHSLRVMLAIVIAVAVLRYAQDVFLPLALAILLTFLLAPMVDRLQRLHITRPVAVIFSVALTMLIIGGLLWIVFHQFTDLANQLPNYRRQLRANLAGVTGAVKSGIASSAEAVDQLTREFGRVAEGLGDDFRPDARRITHGDGQGRLGHGVSMVAEFLRSRR